MLVERSIQSKTDRGARESLDTSSKEETQYDSEATEIVDSDLETCNSFDPPQLTRKDEGADCQDKPGYAEPIKNGTVCRKVVHDSANRSQNSLHKSSELSSHSYLSSSPYSVCIPEKRNVQGKRCGLQFACNESKKRKILRTYRKPPPLTVEYMALHNLLYA
mmetsp:Transcript_18702/g.24427  ORF Transcript_18702/g.24427 Transcript_18702/m.24427 type:complete len:162 (+) Transcript_18702:225-710(+)